MHQPPIKFEVRIGDTFSILTWDLLTLKLVRIIARGVYNLSTDFGVSVTFLSWIIGQHFSDASHDTFVT